LRNWLLIGCVVILLVAIVGIARRSSGPPPVEPTAMLSPVPPPEPMKSAPPAQAEAPTTPLVSSAIRPVVGVSLPIPVVTTPPAMTREPVLVADPVLAIQPGVQVADPSTGGAPCNGRAADNAPATAREDALRRDWPFAPMAAPGNATLNPKLAMGDPKPGDVAERGNLGVTAPASSAVTDALAQERKDPLAGWGPAPAPALDPRRFTEAHWQGIEVIPKSPVVALALNIPADVQGVIIDDATLPADLQGFVAGDVITQVDRVPTPDLTSFIDATDRVRDQPQIELAIVRDGQPKTMLLTALKQRLGTANGETASMIPPGARMPHPYRGPCTNCHRIGTTGRLPVDQGDLVVTTAPEIRADARRPHRDRGPCRACHRIAP
jgi:hypothetical protein